MGTSSIHMLVSRIAPSCNKQLIKNEYVALKPKKKNRMQAKNDAIQNFTVNYIDYGIKKDARKLRAQKRRECSK